MPARRPRCWPRPPGTSSAAPPSGPRSCSLAAIATASWCDGKLDPRLPPGGPTDARESGGLGVLELLVLGLALRLGPRHRDVRALPLLLDGVPAVLCELRLDAVGGKQAAGHLARPAWRRSPGPSVWEDLRVARAMTAMLRPRARWTSSSTSCPEKEGPPRLLGVFLVGKPARSSRASRCCLSRRDSSRRWAARGAGEGLSAIPSYFDLKKSVGGVRVAGAGHARGGLGGVRWPGC